MVQLDCPVPGQDLSLLGAGGPSEVAFDVVLPIGMLSTGSGEGCCPLGLGDCLGTGARRGAVPPLEKPFAIG